MPIKAEQVPGNGYTCPKCDGYGFMLTAGPKGVIGDDSPRILCDHCKGDANNLTHAQVKAYRP